ncbi:MAG: hypothetical protein ABIC95_02830 [archaeon]
MTTIDDLKKDVDHIKARNARVETDKAWETSWTRRIVLFSLTYIVVVILFLAANLPNPFVNALVPALAFVLSTLTMTMFKKMWLQKRR